MDVCGLVLQPESALTNIYTFLKDSFVFSKSLKCLAVIWRKLIWEFAWFQSMIWFQFKLIKDYWGLVSLLFMGRIGRPIGVLYGETVSTVETAYSPLEVT